MESAYFIEVLSKKGFKAFKIITFLWALLFCSNKSYSQNLNLQSLLIGDQAAGMGGAYTALFSDASAASYYNPAALGFINEESVSASVGVFKKFDIHYGDSADIVSASLKMNQGFFRAVPASTAAVLKTEIFDWLKPYTLAFSIIVPEYDEFKGDLYRSESNVATLDYKIESLWVGGSIAKKLSPTQSVGLSLYYVARTFSSNEVQRSSGGSWYFDSETRTFKHNYVLPIIGYQAEIDSSWRWGITVFGPSLKIAGEGERESLHIDSTGITSETPETGVSSFMGRPMQINLGLNYLINRWSIAFDIKHSLGQEAVDFEGKPYAQNYSFKPITNISLGSEYILQDNLHLRAGIFSDFSPHESQRILVYQNQADYIDQGGFSANVVYKQKNMQYTFGGYYLGGKGHSWHKVQNNIIELSKQSHVFTMLVGVHYSM